MQATGAVRRLIHLSCIRRGLRAGWVGGRGFRGKVSTLAALSAAPRLCVAAAALGSTAASVLSGRRAQVGAVRGCRAANLIITPRGGGGRVRQLTYVQRCSFLYKKN